MSEKIGGRPPRAPVARMPAREASESGVTKTTADAVGPSALKDGEASGVTDRFERQAAGGPASALKTQLQTLVRGTASGRVQFSNEDLAYLANTFAALLRQHPKATRSKRARLFTKAILRGHKKLGRLLERVPEEEAEQMFEAIADALDGSPVFAQMIENVTEEAGKLNG